ncbi:MAG: hypothetical protein MI867_04210 [Pseudomonadales bacterium]|nr:hypothetical protein [Pseudomonadales bacterium]
MNVFSDDRPLKRWIARAAETVVRALVLIVFLCASQAYANSQELNRVKTEINQLSRSIQQDEKAIKQLERIIWGLDAKILDAQKQIRKERDEQRADFHTLKRDVKKQGFDIERINNSISLIDQEIELVQRDSQRSQEYFNTLNPIKRQFEETAHLEKLSNNQDKVEALLSDKQSLIESKNAAEAKHNLMNEKLNIAKSTLDGINVENDPRFTSLINKRESSGFQITNMRKQLKQNKNRVSYLSNKAEKLKQQVSLATAKTKERTKAKPKPVIKREVVETSIPGKRPAIVFVVSGEQEKNIEDSLKLKDWVESYGARYIQARWNGFEQGADSDIGDTRFMQQFAQQLERIDDRSKIIIIGHGRGGGAAIKAATEVAFNANRTIDFLAVLDPIGEQNLRANIVYDTPASCATPVKNDQATNTQYVNCLREAKKRIITANVKHFYNRWQKDGQGPADFQRRIKAIDENGEDVDAPTATGRFITANSITSDQKRVFFGKKEDAHKALLNDEARNLPRLLVKHLR